MQIDNHSDRPTDRNNQNATRNQNRYGTSHYLTHITWRDSHLSTLHATITTLGHVMYAVPINTRVLLDVMYVCSMCRPDLPTYSSTYLATYLPSYLPTYLQNYLPTELPTELPTYLQNYLPTELPTYLLRGTSPFAHPCFPNGSPSPTTT